MTNQFDDQYWSNRYLDADSAWDMQQVSPPLAAYIDQWKDKGSAILIPGCGNAYEAGYLLQKGFSHITLIDISATLVGRLQTHFSGKPINIIHGDFFEHTGHYDLILEQTFFCALDPALRERYVQQMHALLNPGGTLAGVLFNRPFEGGPPFGGSTAEYTFLMQPFFHIITLETCYNSIGPRQGSEVFLIARRK